MFVCVWYNGDKSKLGYYKVGYLNKVIWSTNIHKPEYFYYTYIAKAQFSFAHCKFVDALYIIVL